jgi:hypothetical protein
VGKIPAHTTRINWFMEQESPKKSISFASSAEMQERVVLYIDLLGFKNKVNGLDEQS